MPDLAQDLDRVDAVFSFTANRAIIGEIIASAPDRPISPCDSLKNMQTTSRCGNVALALHRPSENRVSAAASEGEVGGFGAGGRRDCEWREPCQKPRGYASRLGNMRVGSGWVDSMSMNG